ncbi:AHH domain-containing protein [Vitiosangium sp. GDMCC 1.1324]|uniref:AHH domain-containing protein n=1 Tax=Vitiosangium sp. (strain GDMCC 1.1324) TaxID=2138576 RepID=UPI000D3DA3C5|nr:AHH domain-containing protein [Vitiosangium sp. GDMCC 1.1324]PTL83418.1 hypothetical protein DAT35_15710 [Vitiosangium sp. GDMCC 1.1324]
MSQKQHNWDAKNLKGKHKPVPGSTDGGSCLNRHIADRHKGPEGVLKEHSCNYRWQGFKRALEDPKLYNWPRYKALCEQISRSPRLTMLARTVGGRMEVDAPKEGLWDVKDGGKNFRTSCNLPYWHESHHIIPDSNLTTAIAKLGAGTPYELEYKKLVRTGLLEESYNLNHTLNMIILPMDERIALTLGLPRHRISADTFSHNAYSEKVQIRLDALFNPVQEKLQNHEAPDYKFAKTQLEALSKELYPMIVLAGKLMKKGRVSGGSVEEMPKDLFRLPQETPSGSAADFVF